MSARELRFRAAGVLGSGFLGLLGRSLRFEVEGAEHLDGCRRRGQPVIFAFWHAWLLPMAYLHRNEGVVVLVSEHGDGEYIARTLRRMGSETSRGSSTRGGTRGLRGVIRAIQEGRDVAFTPDGPRGPARQFKRGGLVASQLTGAPILPISLGSREAWRLNSWDRFAIPKPFGRLHVRYGAPHTVPRDASEEELTAATGALERALSVIGDGA